VTRKEAIEWQERLFPRRKKRILNDDGTPTDQMEDLPVELPEICLALRASCNGSADPWPVERLSEVGQMLRARAKTWTHHAHEDPIDDAVLQMVREAASIAESCEVEHLRAEVSHLKRLIAIPSRAPGEYVP